MSFKDTYEINDKGCLTIHKRHRRLLTHLFAQAGINIHDIKTEDDFDRAIRASIPYFWSSFLWEIEQHDNKYYLGAFTALLQGDHKRFHSQTRKGHLLNDMRKNTLTSKKK